MTPLTLTQAKALARSLRHAMAAQGQPISHAAALEHIAHHNGARDWNTLHARLSQAPEMPFAPGDRVEGAYLGIAFTGTLRAIAPKSDGFRVQIRFDAPIDTVRFDSFSNLRRQVQSIIDQTGHSLALTSNGAPQLVIRRAP
ncbi:glyoxalase superfamily protein [Pararhodobacter zhoushanensis]|uniref:Glyoxalase superfamily protein n=1 Tax=Pararhodobacter zhoushanensis TaxID=2479545 RepID=A0ABT3H2T9_9RHOB|nr:glyoxalase superfamily protein [Pararhodobacter zhoushanensis]MCW1934154.1 glyoxalase superfamily protein [Pararhodobacter zhoushanensis]